MVAKDEDDLESKEKAIVEETIEEKGLPEAESIENLVSDYTEDNIKRAKVKLLAERYADLRRIKSDDGLFYSVFLFAYVGHIWTTRDTAELERLKARLTLCKFTNDIRRKPCARFEEYREMFVQLLNEQIEENLRPGSYQEFMTRIRSQWPLMSIRTLLHFIATNESARQAAQVLASPSTDYNKVHEIVGGRRRGMPFQRMLSALSDAQGVAVRVVLLDDQVNFLWRPKIYHEDYSPSNEWQMPEWSRRPLPPNFISPDEMERTLKAARDVPTANRRFRQILLFRPTAQANHFDMLYPK